MAKRNGLARWLTVGVLGALMATDAPAQHPTLGPDYPAPDPRSDAPSSGHTSFHRTLETTWWQGAEGCAFRAYGVRIPDRAYYVDAWALGVQKDSRATILYFEARVLDRDGTALPIQRPTLYMFPTGPTYGWREAPSPHEGYVRIQRELAETPPREIRGFVNSVMERGLRELAVTLPGGRGEAYFWLFDGATPRQFEKFADCVCELLGKDNAIFDDCT